MKNLKKGLILAASLTLGITLAGCSTTPAPEVVLASISVTAPTKTSYFVGDTFDPIGLVVVANYSDETIKTLAASDYTYTAPDLSTAGNKQVVVTYEEKEVSKSASFTVSVSEIVAVSLQVTPPSQLLSQLIPN